MTATATKGGTDGLGLGKDLTGLQGLSCEQIEGILDTAEPFKEISERRIKKVPTLRGKTVVNLFMEPSTRTRASLHARARSALPSVLPSSTTRTSKSVKVCAQIESSVRSTTFSPLVRDPSPSTTNPIWSPPSPGTCSARDTSPSRPTMANRPWT